MSVAARVRSTIACARRLRVLDDGYAGLDDGYAGLDDGYEGLDDGYVGLESRGRYDSSERIDSRMRPNCCEVRPSCGERRTVVFSGWRRDGRRGARGGRAP